MSLPIAPARPVPISPDPPPVIPSITGVAELEPRSSSINRSCWAFAVSGNAPLSAPPPAAFNPLFASASPKFTMMARCTTSRLPFPDAVTVTIWKIVLVDRLPRACAGPEVMFEPPIVTNVTLFGPPPLFVLTEARAKFKPEFATPTPMFSTEASWLATSPPVSWMVCLTAVVPVLPVALDCRC